MNFFNIAKARSNILVNLTHRDGDRDGPRGVLTHRDRDREGLLTHRDRAGKAIVTAWSVK